MPEVSSHYMTPFKMQARILSYVPCEQCTRGGGGQPCGRRADVAILHSSKMLGSTALRPSQIQMLWHFLWTHAQSEDVGYAALRPASAASSQGGNGGEQVERAVKLSVKHSQVRAQWAALCLQGWLEGNATTTAVPPLGCHTLPTFSCITELL